MVVHNLVLDAFQKFGSPEVTFAEEGMKVSSPIAINNHFDKFTDPIRHYIFYPEKFRLPMKIEFTVRMDSPTLYVLVGKGHVSFNSYWNDNRRISDIAVPDLKPVNFRNEMPVNQDVRISILYGTKVMQIWIDGEERYYTEKSAYMKKKRIEEVNKKGLEFRLMCSKRTKLLVRNVTVTEYENGEEPAYPHDCCEPPLLSIDKNGSAELEACISYLSEELQDKIRETDQYLLKNKKLGIKRKIEGSHRACKITYLSKIGFSYSMVISKNVMYHFFWWYIVSNYKYENKYGGRKNDLTEQTLRRIQEREPELAEKLFDFYIDCFGCCPGCAARTLYEFDGRKRMTCHGKMLFKMITEDFDCMMRMMDVIGELNELSHQGA